MNLTTVKCNTCTPQPHLWIKPIKTQLALKFNKTSINTKLMQGTNSQIQMPQWPCLANSNPDISRKQGNKQTHGMQISIQHNKTNILWLWYWTMAVRKTNSWKSSSNPKWRWYILTPNIPINKSDVYTSAKFTKYQETNNPKTQHQKSLTVGKNKKYMIN